MIESYFGGKWIKGKRGRRSYKKTPVFGILKRGGKVHTEIVPDFAKHTLQAIIRGRVSPDNSINQSAPCVRKDGAAMMAWLI